MFFFNSLPDFDTSILPICKDSLGWMFNKLDMNFDLLLDQSELNAIYLDKYEVCMKPLFNSCDSFKDGKLSNNEWCYCFQKPEGEAAETNGGVKTDTFWEKDKIEGEKWMEKKNVRLRNLFKKIVCGGCHLSLKIVCAKMDFETFSKSVLREKKKTHSKHQLNKP